MKHILFVTGTRADFGKLEPLAKAARDDGYRVTFFVTGMHMLARYGTTKLEVHRIEDVSVHEFLNQRDDDPQDIILSKTVSGFSDFLAEAAPDLVVVHGDRVEALACALVCATNYVRCAHVEGGEVSGTIDELFRHCITKLASDHFVSSQRAATRVMTLGEEPASVHPIGSPELDFHAGNSGVGIDEVKKRYGIGFDDFGICTFHPVTSEQDSIAGQADDLFASLEASDRNFVVILPNNDPGADGILAAIDRLPESRFRVLPSMRFSYFSELMKNAACMVGNSSVGVREAPFLGLPSLNIGTRQTNRAESPSLETCLASDRESIAQFLSTEWGKRYEPNMGFGEGKAADRFVRALAAESFWSRPMQKQFQDIHPIADPSGAG